MTEENELSIHDMCERVGRSIARCKGNVGRFACGRSMTCKCAGTGVEPKVLNALYLLAHDVADLAQDDAFADGQRDMAECLTSNNLFGAVN